MTQSTLPKGWRKIPNRTGIWYRVPKRHRHLFDNKSTFKLGITEAEAYRTWYERTGGDDTEIEETTVEYVLDAYMENYVAPFLAPSTFESYSHYIKPLKRAFGHLHPASVLPKHVFRYMSERDSKVSANREASVMSGALGFALERGWVEHNPLQGAINRKGERREKPRTRVPSLEDLLAFCEIQPLLRGYISLKKIIGIRKGQMLAINLNDHWDGTYLHPVTSKGGVDTRYTGQIVSETINHNLGNRLPVGPLFLNTNGEAMTVTGFDSMWQRSIRKFVAAGYTRFTEHDIRKFTATEAESLEQAQHLLGHTSPKITKQVYRIAPETVDVR